MFNKTRRNYQVSSDKPPFKKKSSRKLIPSQRSSRKDYDLPEWYLEGLPKLKRTIKHKYTPISHGVLSRNRHEHSPKYKSPLAFMDVLYPAWVGRVPYPDSVDLVQSRYKWGLEYGVGARGHQLLWQKHLKVMKKYLDTKPKLPTSRDLWTKEQLDILWNFYKIYNPKKLTDKSRKGFDGLIDQLGPFVVEREIRDKYPLPFHLRLLGEKIIDLKVKPHIYTLKKGTYLFHGSPQPDLNIIDLIEPDMMSDHLGFSRFLFFGLSAAISLWYTVERFSKRAMVDSDPGEFEAYLYVYRLEKDLEFQYIEDDIIYNQESSLFRGHCNKMPCLHPQFAYHSIEQLDNAQGPVELDWELTIPIKSLREDNLVLEGKYYINVLKLLANSGKNINEFDPISAVDFSN